MLYLVDDLTLRDVNGLLTVFVLDIKHNFAGFFSSKDLHDLLLAAEAGDV